METLFGLVDPAAIAALPWYVGVPGVLLVAMFLWRAVKAALTLRPLRMLTSLVLAFAIAVILSSGGQAIVDLIGRAS